MYDLAYWLPLGMISFTHKCHNNNVTEHENKAILDIKFHNFVSNNTWYNKDGLFNTIDRTCIAYIEGEVSGIM